MTDNDSPVFDISALAHIPAEGPTEFGMTRICEISGVHERSEGNPAELWRHDVTGRLFVRAYNEGGNNSTDVDLVALFAGLRITPSVRFDGQTRRRVSTGVYRLPAASLLPSQNNP